MSYSNQNHFELELKLDLQNQEALNRLLTHFSWQGPPLLQNNYFFDAPEGFLRYHRYALRIRNENGRFLLTVKGPKLSSGDLVVRNEIECPLNSEIARSLLNNPNLFFNFYFPPFQWLEEKTEGSLKAFSLEQNLFFKNERDPVYLPSAEGTICLELDKTDYGSGEFFYELEAEFPSEEHYQKGRVLIEDLLLQLKIPWKISEASKYARGLLLKQKI